MNDQPYKNQPANNQKSAPSSDYRRDRVPEYAGGTKNAASKAGGKPASRKDA